MASAAKTGAFVAMDVVIHFLSALGGIFLLNCNLLEWVGLAILQGAFKYFGAHPAPWLGKSWNDKPWYWRYLTVSAITPVACVVLFVWAGRVPAPAVPDEWSHLFLADTLLEGRFANPAHPLPQFFEAIHILPDPTRSSMYLFGPALWFAIGKLIFGSPYWGVALSGALLSAALLWALSTLR